MADEGTDGSESDGAADDVELLADRPGQKPRHEHRREQGCRPEGDGPNGVRSVIGESFGCTERIERWWSSIDGRHGGLFSTTPTHPHPLINARALVRIRHRSRSLRTLRHSFGHLMSVSEVFRIFILPSRSLASVRANEDGSGHYRPSRAEQRRRPNGKTP